MQITDENHRSALAQSGYENIKAAIIDLLRVTPNGLSNSEVAELLGLRTGLDGRQKDYLTWSILQDLVFRKVLRKIPKPNSKRHLLYQYCA